ncbi:Trm112 family protein [Candidatus Electrothrix sp.]|uniref:Trm112 family protein n=1 Tax=Candidatus Electrothrix sp. TaxID=2170559 RepID=UPI004057509D
MKKELLDIIACPQCKGSVELRNDKNVLLCHTCQLAYAIRDGIPIMIIEEAKPISSFSEISSQSA